MVVAEVAMPYGESDGDDGYRQKNCDSTLNGRNSTRGHRLCEYTGDDCGDGCLLCVL
jgi:hypothetical protein